MPLTVREFKNVYRDKQALGARFGACIFLGILQGLIFWQVGDTTQPDYNIQSHFGAITMICIGAMFLNAQPVILSFPSQRPVFIREYASGLYGTIPYVLANTIISIPLSYITVVVQLCCTYFLMGFNGNWGIFSAILLLQVISCSFSEYPTKNYPNSSNFCNHWNHDFQSTMFILIFNIP